jgi:hypothetical protein
MRKQILTIILVAFTLPLLAQQTNSSKTSTQTSTTTTENVEKPNKTKAIIPDSTIFKCELFNKEYNVYIRIDLNSKQIRVPGQDIFGFVPGFFGDYEDARKWLFTDAELMNSHTAKLQIVNDYGSEDLEATLSYEKDGTYVLTQGSGSILKIARNRKWVKIPKKLVFTRR